MPRLGIAATLVLLATGWLSAPRAASDAYQIDAAQSRVMIAVGKAGAFSFLAGHTHEVSGPIQSGSLEVDPDNPSRSRLRVVIETATLKVTGANEPPDDRPKVQQAMESDKVLEVGRFPRITFESTQITTKRHESTALDVVVGGQLTIRDVTRPISAPVHVEIAGNSLTATGRFSVKQTEFGIKPISVGGVVAVKDALDIMFTIVARR
ncbi:MAG: hypothetical protein C5B57_02955 [Blastocatellia bacterium]|nr:MAG: hypothetical protein C5B57_02955 [Blastocatellia bacterium]